jgi:predicted nucleotidyltransferase
MATRVSATRLVAYRREAWAQQQRHQALLIARRREARAAAAEAGRILRERYGAAQVWLFGSVATGLGFHERSDIDLAVEGIALETFWRAASEAERAARPFEIDVIDLTSAPPSLRAHVHATGVVL